MKSRKAQTGSALSWFIGSIVVAFILLLFFIFGFGKTAVQQTIQGKPEVKLTETTAFHQSEQQRQMFVFFESEYENKDNYDIIHNLAKKIKKEDISNKEDTAYTISEKRLESYLEEQRKSTENCFNFFILDNTISYLGDGFSGYSEGDTIYYLSFPENKRLDKSVSELSRTINLERDYSFFFPEKSFALIKYIPTECSEKDKNE